MIEAADGVAFDPAWHHRHAAMGAARRHDMRLPALAAIDHEVLAEDADRLDVADLEIGRVIDRMPEAAHVAAIQRPRADALDVRQGDLHAVFRVENNCLVRHRSSPLATGPAAKAGTAPADGYFDRASPKSGAESNINKKAA